jgi:pyruvate kinase
MDLGKKTKIVCTIGPATESVEKLTELAHAGMNVMRLNFSHGDFKEHGTRVTNLRKVIASIGKPIAIMQDLGGPKIRIGEFGKAANGAGFIVLKEGQTFTLTTNESEKLSGDEKRVWINYPLLPKEVSVGGDILLHDGKKRLKIVSIKGHDVVCKVIVGGEIKGKRGVNLPGAHLTISSITEKDRKDLEFGIKNKVDYIALSFVRRPADILELREILKKAKSNASIIAKIETPEALENIDEIIALTDAIMIARGDLAIEIPAEDVPLAQKMLIKKCNALGKPVITATQMLESMIKSPVPTRAEVSDVANAIMDGTDAVMLSEETTLGDFPVEAVNVMTRVALKVEDQSRLTKKTFRYDESHDLTDTVSQSAVRIASETNAKYIIALTKSGRAARMIARYRPLQQVLALTSNTKDANKLTLTYGCNPILVPHFSTVEDIMGLVREVTLKKKFAKKGEKVVIIAGMPVGKVKETNMVLVEQI